MLSAAITLCDVTCSCPAFKKKLYIFNCTSIINLHKDRTVQSCTRASFLYSSAFSFWFLPPPPPCHYSPFLNIYRYTSPLFHIYLDIFLVSFIRKYSKYIQTTDILTTTILILEFTVGIISRLYTHSD